MNLRRLEEMQPIRLLPVALAFVLIGSVLPAQAGAKKIRHVRSLKAALVHHQPKHQVLADGTETGQASWYGPWHAGRRTANGERFDPKALTAAHPTLPMNTEVRVRNLENGRTVTVRINDRLPKQSPRIIDLSEHAAAELGMERRGHAPVLLEALNSPDQ
jgi:rare lipoprotein A (peptidoglycan hydrolase)